MNDLNLLLTSYSSKKQKKIFYKQLNNSKKTIDSLSKSPFGCLNLKVWKVLNYYALKNETNKNSNDTYIFMGDINNLKTANIDIGIEAANNHILNIISQMNNILDDAGLNYSIGKADNGDEIFIFVKGINSEEEFQSIFSKLNNVKSDILSIVFTSTNDLNNGLEIALANLDKQLNYAKVEYKKNLYSEIFGTNFLKYLEIMYEQLLNKLRLDIDEMTKEQKKILKSNLELAQQSFSNSSLNDIVKDVESSNPVNIDNKDLIFDRIVNLENLFKLFSGNDFDLSLMENFTLSQILANHSIAGLEDKYVMTQFNDEDSKKSFLPNFINSFINKKIYKDTLVLTVELSKIKFINDKYGHIECDNQVSSLINNISSYIMSDNSNITLKPINASGTDISIISSGISTFSFLIEKPKDEKELSNLENYIANISKSTKLLVSSSISPLLSENDNKLYLSESFTRVLEDNKINNRKSIINKKVRDINFINEQVFSILYDFYYSPEFEVYCENLDLSKKEVLDTMLNRCFPLQEVKNNSNIVERKNTKEDYEK